MSEFTRQALERPEVWKRGLYMILFAVLYGVAEVVLTMLVLVQFVIVLFTGTTNEQLLRLGSSLSRYAYQVFTYVTFNSEEQPFPMSAWPEDDAESSPWFEAPLSEEQRRAEAARDEDAARHDDQRRQEEVARRNEASRSRQPDDGDVDPEA